VALTVATAIVIKAPNARNTAHVCANRSVTRLVLPVRTDLSGAARG
jgi:hypothetical protein